MSDFTDYLLTRSQSLAVLPRSYSTQLVPSYTPLRRVKSLTVLSPSYTYPYYYPSSSAVYSRSRLWDYSDTYYPFNPYRYYPSYYSPWRYTSPYSSYLSPLYSYVSPYTSYTSPYYYRTPYYLSHYDYMDSYYRRRWWRPYAYDYKTYYPSYYSRPYSWYLY